MSPSMFESVSGVAVARNVVIYLAGVGMAVAGALGLAEAIELQPVVSVPLFVVGLAIVVFVHEYLGGPV